MGPPFSSLRAGEPDLLFIDLHLVHEVTSPQAFDGLRLSGRTVRGLPDSPRQPTTTSRPPISLCRGPGSKKQLEVLDRNCSEFGIACYPMGHADQGIVHVIGPELGLSLPGMTIVCGDSHTSTHGAFGALAFGIGTSEVEHVLATQTLPQTRPKTMAVEIDGDLPPGVTAKDLVLAIIGVIGTGGGIGHVIEYRGARSRRCPWKTRITVCNMSIEAGARAGMVAPDETTFAYVKGRRHAPTGDAWDAALSEWMLLRTDEGAVFDKVVHIDAASLTPHVTWGTNPGQVAPIGGKVPDPSTFAEADQREAAARALEYMGLSAGAPIRDIRVDTVFIGSCTNSRIEDLRAAASVLVGQKVASGVRALAVPGSRPCEEPG